MRTFKSLALAAALAMAGAAHAQTSPLTAAQITALRSHACADVATARPMMLAGTANPLVTWLNSPSTAVAWKNSVPIAQVGIAFNSGELAGLTTANNSRLQTMVLYAGGAFNPSQADVRAGFDSVFSGAGGASTRAALLALWKRAPTNAERGLATGIGTDAAPATMAWEGFVPASVVTGIVFNPDGSLRGC